MLIMDPLIKSLINLHIREIELNYKLVIETWCLALLNRKHNSRDLFVGHERNSLVDVEPSTLIPKT